MRVVCVGDCGIDHYLPSGHKCCGGITANFARHAARQFFDGDEIQLVSCVGDDVDATLVFAALKSSDIDCYVTQQHGSTPVQTIEIQVDGEKNFVRYDEGVLRDFRFSAEQQRIVRNSDLLVAPVYLQIVNLYDELLTQPISGQVAIDFADFLHHPDFSLLEKHIAKIDIGFFGLASDATRTIERLSRLAEQFNKTFVITLGANGSRVYRGNVRTDCAAVKVDNIVDTTGAGDAYAAGFLSQYCHGKSVIESMQHGAVLAAEVIGGVGAFSQGLD